MLEGIEALMALERTGTISEAANQLRLTQSAVSKRIQTLESDLGYKIIEPQGRKVQITAKGYSFLNKAKPLLLELKNLKQLGEGSEARTLSIALSDSIAASWGPKLLRLAAKKLKNLDFEIHVHRSTLVEESVKLGRYDLGLCVGYVENALVFSSHIVDEPMVFLPNKLDTQSESKTLLCIETNSGTWKLCKDKILRHAKLKNYDLIHLESFAAIIQMVKEGYGNAIIPYGIALSMLGNKKETQLLSPTINRPIKLISHKNTAQLPSVAEFKNQLIDLAQEVF